MERITTVLVVDDDAQIRRGISRQLAGQGYSVVEARSGYEALERLRLQTPRLVVLDLNMPGMSGWDALPEIRKLYSELPVVIFSSAIDDPDVGDALRDLGATKLCHKPDMEELVQVVRELVPQ